MKEKYNALFDKLAPQRSDEELLRAVLDRKAVNMSNSKEKKKLGRKAVIIPAVAAAALLCTTVGVSAAKSWTVFDSVFNQKPETPNANGFVFDDFDFNEFGGKKLNETFDYDGYSIELKSVVADKYSMMIFYDVILDEVDRVFTNIGGSYTYTEGDKVFLNIFRQTENDLNAYKAYLDANRNPDGTYISGLTVDFRDSHVMLEKDDNVFHCMFRYDSIGVPIEGTEVIFEIWGLNMGTFSIGGYDPNNIKRFSINFDFIKDNDDLIVEGNAPFTLDSGENGVITYAHLTSLTLDLLVEWEKGPLDLPVPDFGDDLEKAREYSKKAMDEMNKAYPEVKVRFKDGTVAENGALSWDDTRAGGAPDESQTRLAGQNLTLNWKYPVKVADIDAIIIGDGEFKIN